MRVAAVQHDIVWKDPIATHRRVEPMIARAAGDGAHLVVLAEMFSTGFATSAADIAQPMDGSSVEFLRTAADRHRTWVAASVPILEPGNARARNRFIAAGPAGELATYDKRHPFSYAGEHLEFDPGDAVITIEIEGMRVTPFVCYDLRFADDFWGAGPTTDLFVVVANWPEPRRQHWSALLTARAIENQCYVVGVNRIGTAEALTFSGDSAVISPTGQQLAGASWVETVLTVDVDASEVAGVRERFPFLQDRRDRSAQSHRQLAQ